jgi:hypothetical protein
MSAYAGLRLFWPRRKRNAMRSSSRKVVLFTMSDVAVVSLPRHENASSGSTPEPSHHQRLPPRWPPVFTNEMAEQG